MCGICGFVHNRIVDENELKDMTKSIVHRGPNDSGTYIEYSGEYQIGLGHRRLSILDLSSAGHQPMSSSDGTVTIVYNGEVYNFGDVRSQLSKKGYIFKSNCDTEVILDAYVEWGIDCVSKFNGMFAIAIWDSRNSELYLVRDRMGVKPLFYYIDENNIVFGSELKAIYKYPYFKARINQNSLALFIEKQYITGPETIYENTYKLEPGCYLKWAGGQIEINRYWVYKPINSEKRFLGTYDEAKDRLEQLLIDSVEKRMISDVPIGAFLSGGYDSTLITAIMQNISSRPVDTFTIGFNESEYDESQYANDVASYLGTSHHCEMLSVQNARDFIEDIPYYFDEPMADASQIATMLLSKITKKYVTVALSGDAGDELFCGYSTYSNYEKLQRMRLLAKILNATDSLLHWNDRLPYNVHRLSRAISDEGINAAKHAVFYERYPNLLNVEGLSPKYKPLKQYSDKFIEALSMMDINTYLPDDIMVKVDRASMAYSLETRAPFLDYRLVELAMNLPLEYKYCNGNKKRIIKDLVYRYVPREVMERPKQGFAVPVLKWMRDDWNEFTKGLFEKTYVKRQGLFDYSETEKMKRQFLKTGDKYVGNVLWSIFVFQMWYEKWLY